MTSFRFEPIYGSLLVAILSAAAIVAVIVFFAPRTIEPKNRRTLIILRSVAALALLLLAFRPSLIQTDKRPADATLVIGCDVSRSMTLPDNESSDRWTTQLKAWKKLAAGLEQFDETLDVQLVAYGDVAQTIANVNAESLSGLEPSGESTDLGSATAFALQAAGANPLAGIVFLGDGRHTAAASDDASSMTSNAQRTVETLNSLGVPFWTIPIGPAAGTSANRDVAVDGLPENFQLFAGNEFPVAFEVQCRGLAGVDVPISVTWIREDGRSTEAKTRLIVPERSDETIGVKLVLTAPGPGAYRLEVAAKKRSGELVTQNNKQTAFVDIRAGGGRILYLEGTPRPEQTFLRQSLRRFPDLDLRYKWLRQDLDWPVDLDGRFKAGRFDVFILGDLDARALGDEQLKDLADAVAGGAGLITLGGYQSYGRGGYAKGPLADVLPIKMDAGRRRDVNAERSSADPSQLGGPIELLFKRNHPVTDLGGSPPAEVWRELPAMPGANLFAGVKAAPGVQVLLEDGKGNPMMVVGEYGSGRVASLAFDSTWRWWRAGKSDAHRRFWRQCLLWLLAREETGGDRIVIEIDSRRFAAKSNPEFRARIESVAAPSTKRILTTEVVDSNGKAIALETNTEGLGDENVSAINGKIPDLAPGFYRLRVSAENDPTVAPTDLAFQVIENSRELAEPMADPVYLRQLAEITADHGGAAYSPDEVDELLSTIADRRKQAETPVVEKLRLGDGPLTGWLVFVIFAAALSVEWYLRRQWGLA